ncbi:hypothetical protein GPJ56_008621 [Histomonas meleagridis]|uniref:uncharacterized protein n=1 Tax=Histomonas meleagridis TaxID=135588 RepID=UPI003559A7FD|nr:hypothetical protein GPJ56_008621 [Histomonas meleagridis]KAH0805802.1 hypothetical protein GO595_001441 [Histomonas meleagridis]
MNQAFPLYRKYLNDRSLIPNLVKLIYSYTESDESSRDIRLPKILECCDDEELKYVILSYSVIQEKIFTTKLCDLYSGYVKHGIEIEDYQPYSIHILRYLIPISPDIISSYMDKINSLIEDDRTTLQVALIQLLVDINEETLITKIIDHTKSIDVMSLALHMISELGTISSNLLIDLFKRIGSKNIENVCTERCTIESVVGQIQLGKLTSTWNSAAINEALISHIKSIPLENWDVEFELCKLLLKQPMDSNSAQTWKRLFAQLLPQFEELMRDEDKAEIVFDLIGFYLSITSDLDFFENLQSSLERVVTVAKEKCKAACTKFLNEITEIGPKFKKSVTKMNLLQ